MNFFALTSKGSRYGMQFARVDNEKMIGE